jgi:hypothetical protein
VKVLPSGVTVELLGRVASGTTWAVANVGKPQM